MKSSSVKAIISALAISVLAFATTAQAQEKKGKGKGGGLNVEQIETAVGSLTAEQKTKIEAILAKAREDGKADASKRGEVQAQARKDIRAVLTPDQQKKFDEMPMGGKKKN